MCGSKSGKKSCLFINNFFGLLATRPGWCPTARTFDPLSVQSSLGSIRTHGGVTLAANLICKSTQRGFSKPVLDSFLTAAFRRKCPVYVWFFSGLTSEVAAVTLCFHSTTPARTHTQQRFTHCCLIMGMLTQFAAATATKGTQRATRGGAFCKRWRERKKKKRICAAEE